MADVPRTTWNGDQPDPVMTAIAPVVEKRNCWCEFVDIGVGSQRVAENPECPVHTEIGFALGIVEALNKAGLLTTRRPYPCDGGGQLGGFFPTACGRDYMHPSHPLGQPPKTTGSHPSAPEGGESRG